MLSANIDFFTSKFEFYQGINYEDVLTSNDSYASRVRYIEYIMSQEEILTILGVEERIELKDICVKNAVERNEKYREQLPMDSVLLLIARIANMDDPAFSEYVNDHEKVQNFIKNGMLVAFTQEEYNDFMSFVLASYNTTDRESTGYIDRSNSFVTVYTPKWSAIQAIAYSDDLITAEKNQIDYEIGLLTSSYNWDSVRVSDRGPTSAYNCHSYAWYSQSANNSYWINQYWTNPSTGNYTNVANLSKYWTDGSYLWITDGNGTSIPSSVPNGSKVFYALGDHSAIKISNTYFISKWGKSGLYIHTPSNAPYNSTLLKFIINLCCF